MRRRPIRSSQKPTLGLVMGGGEESGSVYSHSGHLKVASTTTQPISKEAQLLELLNSLEKEVENLQSKYLEALDTWTSVTEILVRRSRFTEDSIITKE